MSVYGDGFRGGSRWGDDPACSVDKDRPRLALFLWKHFGSNG